jgi:hypothetical protein
MDLNQVQEKIKAKADKNSVQILLFFQYFAMNLQRFAGVHRR